MDRAECMAGIRKTAFEMAAEYSKIAADGLKDGFTQRNEESFRQMVIYGFNTAINLLALIAAQNEMEAMKNGGNLSGE